MGKGEFRFRPDPCNNAYGGKVRLRWDPTAAVTAYGQMPYFIEFLKTAGLFEQ